MMYQSMISPANLRIAWNKVHSNASACGYDETNLKDYMQNSDLRLENLYEKLQRHDYQPAPVKRIVIENKNQKQREIFLLSIEDKIVQNVIKLELEKIYSNYFSHSSYAFQKNRSALQAIDDVDHYVTDCSNLFVLQTDIQDFFPSVLITTLMNKLKEKITDDNILHLIGQSLHLYFLNRNGQMEALEGLCQGSIISPILSNIYLHEFDEFIHMFPVKYYRYADDILLFSSEESLLYGMIHNITLFLEPLGLTLKKSKPRSKFFRRVLFF